MRVWVWSGLCAFLAGCAGKQLLIEQEAIPYKAVVAIEWVGDGVQSEGALKSITEGGGDPGAALASSPDVAVSPESGKDPSGRFFRQQVEDEIRQGLEEFKVFTDVVVTDISNLYEETSKNRADIMVIVRLGDLVRWEDQDPQIVSGFAVLNTVLWLATGFGSWWIPDIDYPTISSVEVAWKRVDFSAWKRAPSGKRKVPALTAPQADFRKERLSSGSYRLSFWDRAKPWRYPLPYLVGLLVPPSFNPLTDTEEVDMSLEQSAMKDFQRDLALKMKGGSIGSAGAPYLFQLEGPKNGSTVDGDAVRLQFRYSRELSLESETVYLFSDLYILLKREGDKDYKMVKAYDDTAKITPINQKIKGDEVILEDIQGLSSGRNLILFVARIAPEGKWITNTIALYRP